MGALIPSKKPAVTVVSVITEILVSTGDLRVTPVARINDALKDNGFPIVVGSGVNALRYTQGQLAEAKRLAGDILAKQGREAVRKNDSLYPRD